MERKIAYESPLGSRYASREMLYLFSPDNKFITWRRLWVALAEAEQELGLAITDAQIAELRAHAEDIDYAAARAYEERVRHDVMAHVHAYADQCGADAGAILHLGATSCYVTDNTDALILRDALRLIRSKLLEAIRRLRAFALEHKDLPTLGLTHLQPAQPVTVGKRACLWMQDLMMDVDDLDHALSTVKLLGSKGTTGTQASFMALFDDDDEKVLALEKRVAEKMGLAEVYPVSGQTYPRKLDSRILAVLSGMPRAPTSLRRTSAFCRRFTSARSPSARSRSAPARWPTSETPCARSASAPSAAT
jgi:adenylosuccinate lyase